MPVANLSGYRAQVLINGVPYWFQDLRRDFLYPQEAYFVQVPADRPYDLDAAVYIYDDWFEVELESGRGTDLIIDPEF